MTRTISGPLDAYRALDDGRHRAEFYRMWLAGQSAGLTLPKILEAMGIRESANVEASRTWLLDGATRGRGVAELVRAAGERFEPFESSLLTLGDETGTLEKSLRLLADFYSGKHKLMLKVKKQMAYPFFNLLFACFIAPLGLLFSGYVRSYVIISFGSLTVLFAAGGTIIAAMARRYGNKPPLVRARFARSLATSIEAGLPTPRSVRLAAEASTNPELRAFVTSRTERQLGERPITETLAAAPMMTPDLLALVETAERTGDFTALARFATLYEDGFR